MSQLIAIVGWGAVGRACADQLVAAGHRVVVAQRRRPADLPADVPFRACDVLDPAAVGAAIEGCDQVVLAVGFEYRTAVWRDVWPRAMANVLEACERRHARLVFVDNLYMYGPQSAPLDEAMTLTDGSGKPGVRAAITRQWLAASQAGRVRVAAVRAPDFYGPGVLLSHLGEVGFAALAKRKRVWLLAPPDTPHDFAYVPDIARAVHSLLDAPDDCFGQPWHVPCAPTRTPREILAIGAEALGVPLALTSIPLGFAPLLGIALPFMREFAEMRFTFDRPYRVDASRFARRFWADPTPFETGAAVTARSFAVPAASAARRGEDRPGPHGSLRTDR